jgi:hypothetical protein
MGLSNEELLRKSGTGPLNSTPGTGDFSLDIAADGSDHAVLGVEQMAAFLRILASDQKMLPQVKTVNSRFSKWQESIIESGGRILRVGVQGQVGDEDKIGTRAIEMSTEFLKAVITVTEEAYEDSAAQDLEAALTEVIISQAGFDVEDFMLNSSDGTNSDLNDGASVMELTAGWLEQVDDGPGFYDATADGQDYQTIFLNLLGSIDNRFKRNKSDWRYWVPVTLEEQYRDILSARGTPLGDLTLQGNDALKYQGVQIVGTPTMFVTSGGTSHTLLAGNGNLYAGFQRKIRLETEAVKREGQTYFILTVRCAPMVAVPEAAAAAENVSVS